jgi:putative Mn2+ efflux pump MntP
MDWWEILLIAFGLAMDAFAVSVCKGAGMKKASPGNGLVLGAVFGTFQFAMPIAGFYLGTVLAEVVAGVDHWLAFGLLAFIGTKMAVESFRSDPNACSLPLRPAELVGLGLATSIDAFAIGLSFAFLDTTIFLPAVAIGVVTLFLSFLGFLLGRGIGHLFRHAGLLGGVILLFLGLRILLSHLGLWT